MRGKKQAAAGLNLVAGVIVVLEFGAQGESEQVIDQGDFILDKGVEQHIGSADRIKGDGLAVFQGVMGVAVAQPPGKLLFRGRLKAVLKFKISRAPFVAQKSALAFFPIIIGLERHLRIVWPFFGQPGQDIPALGAAGVDDVGREGRACCVGDVRCRG